jgi:hypothetical protein
MITLHHDDSLTLIESPHEPLGAIKGKDKMFYVSESETFSLRKVSTSNSLLLLDEDRAFLFQEYWELSKAPGQVSELQGFLEAVPFKGVHEEQRALDNYVFRIILTLGRRISRSVGEIKMGIFTRIASFRR